MDVDLRKKAKKKLLTNLDAFGSGDPNKPSAESTSMVIQSYSH